MSVVVPSEATLLQAGGGQVFAMGLPVTADALSLALDLATRTYAAESRRSLLQWGNAGHASTTRYPLTTTATSYELIFETPAQMSADTPSIVLIARADDVGLRLRAWDATKTVVLGSTTISTGAGLEATVTTGLVLTAADIIVTVEAQVLSPFPAIGSIYGVRVVEGNLTVADLP